MTQEQFDQVKQLVIEHFKHPSFKIHMTEVNGTSAKGIIPYWVSGDTDNSPYYVEIDFDKMRIIKAEALW